MQRVYEETKKKTKKTSFQFAFSYVFFVVRGIVYRFEFTSLQLTGVKCRNPVERLLTSS